MKMEEQSIKLWLALNVKLDIGENEMAIKYV